MDKKDKSGFGGGIKGCGTTHSDNSEQPSSHVIRTPRDTIKAVVKAVVKGTKKGRRS